MNYQALFVNPNGRTPRPQFTIALLVLLAAAVPYVFLVPFLLGKWDLLVLLFPAFVLHARRLHDMGRSGWWLLLPAALIATVVGLRTVGGSVQSAATLIAATVCICFAIWGAVGKGEAEAGRRTC